MQVRRTVACSLVQAIMESQNNPLAIMNYQDDPDVMLVSAQYWIIMWLRTFRSSPNMRM